MQVESEQSAEIEGVQCKMARAALGLGVRELAAASKVSTDTIVRFERGEILRERTLKALRQALEMAGVIFINQNGDGPGVRLRKVEPGQAQALPASAGTLICLRPEATSPQEDQP